MGRHPCTPGIAFHERGLLFKLARLDLLNDFASKCKKKKGFLNTFMGQSCEDRSTMMKNETESLHSGIL